jgi:hypothetical protein
MNLKKASISVGLSLIIGINIVYAQESTHAAGGNFSGSGGSVSYSVGQVFYEIRTGLTGTLAEGVQQPWEISVVTAIDQTNGVTLSLFAWPNPTSGKLILNTGEPISSDMFYHLYDTNGKLLHSQPVTGSKTNIDMSNLLPATYFLRVIQNNLEAKTFKIIKR